MLKRSTSPTRDPQKPNQKQDVADASFKRARLSDAPTSDAYVGSTTAVNKTASSPQVQLELPIKKFTSDETEEFWKAASYLKNRQANFKPY